MEDLIAVCEEIRDQLSELNSKFDMLTNSGFTNLSDLITAIEDIQGPTGYNLTDIHEDLSNIDMAIITNS